MVEFQSTIFAMLNYTERCYMHPISSKEYIWAVSGVTKGCKLKLSGHVEWEFKLNRKKPSCWGC